MNTMQKQIKTDMEPKLEATTIKVNSLSGKVETLTTKVTLDLQELNDGVAKVSPTPLCSHSPSYRHLA